MKLKKINTKPPKSGQDIINVLLDALKFARENRLYSIAVVMEAEDETSHEYYIAPDSDVPGMLCELEECKTLMRKDWRDM